MNQKFYLLIFFFQAEELMRKIEKEEVIYEIHFKHICYNQM